MTAKKTKSATSNVSDGGTVAGRHVNMPEDEAPVKRVKLKAGSQANSALGSVFHDTPVYGSVMEVDAEATKRAHAALSTSEDE